MPARSFTRRSPTSSRHGSGAASRSGNTAGSSAPARGYKSVVKLTFAKGAALDDPAGLFNASLEGNVRRAIDLAEGATLDADAFKTLVLAAAALNGSKAKRKPAAKTS